MNMSEQKELNLDDSECVLRAAAKWDRSHVDGRVVMLAGVEIVSFCRHNFGRSKHLGRRREDQDVCDLLATVQAENERLKKEIVVLQNYISGATQF